MTAVDLLNLLEERQLVPAGVVATLRRLERFWMRASDLLQRPGQSAA